MPYLRTSIAAVDLKIIHKLVKQNRMAQVSLTWVPRRHLHGHTTAYWHEFALCLSVALLSLKPEMKRKTYRSDYRDKHI